MPAGYFDNFPYIGYSLNLVPQPGEFEWVTDIFRRTAPIANLLKNKQLFYTYQITDGDTPEMIADKYYGSVKYHWVISILNGITDPILDWPKKYANLVTFINEKYGSMAAAMSLVHHYTMTLAKVDTLGNISSETFIIDKVKYDTLTGLTPEVYTFASGVTVTVTTTRGSVDSYTYEINLNESKRTIVLLKTDYLPQIVSELETLLTP
jgi:hypothetical protein